MRTTTFMLVASIVVAWAPWHNHVAAAQDFDVAKEVSWGVIAGLPDHTFVASVKKVPADGKLAWPTPAANITAVDFMAGRAGDPKSAFAVYEFNRDATKLTIHMPKALPAGPIAFSAEAANKSEQATDGRITITAVDATIHGKTAKLESHPGNQRIGFWSDASDHLSWSYTATRSGMYQAFLTYSVDAGRDEGSEFAVSFDDQKLTGTLKNTGSWYRYTTIPIGKVHFEEPGKHSVGVKCTKKVGPAVMNFKAITLRPTSEGKPITQANDGIVTCHARDVTIHGVKVRWEPIPKKQTVGYWANAKDWVSWQFTLIKPGRYDVEILQGCGKNQGGSEVTLNITGGEKTANHDLTFTVQDTGHWQNFVARRIGTIDLPTKGKYMIQVRPLKKTGIAVMDLRQVRLIPAENR